MQPLKGLFPIKDYPALLVGLTEPDDSAVYQLDADRAIISTVDFFPPVVDEPYAFGVIAAANALSDVYAMGGEPIMAINLVAYPDNLDRSILSEILRGGAEKVREAGAVIAGGHTVTDKEPKYGLAVTGFVRPDRIFTKGGARVGDRLILTKSLGTGVVTTALKNGVAQLDHVEAAITSMSRLNRLASHAAQRIGVNAATDITGYSLLGHMHEMAHLSMTNFHINLQALSWLPGAQTYAQQNIFPGGTWRNEQYFGQWVQFVSEPDVPMRGLLFDPQTSGGLLMSVSEDKAEQLLKALHDSGEVASMIGEVKAGNGHIIVQN